MCETTKRRRYGNKIIVFILLVWIGSIVYTSLSFVARNEHQYQPQQIEILSILTSSSSLQTPSSSKQQKPQTTVPQHNQQQQNKILSILTSSPSSPKQQQVESLSVLAPLSSSPSSSPSSNQQQQTTLPRNYDQSHLQMLYYQQQEQEQSLSSCLKSRLRMVYPTPSYNPILNNNNNNTIPETTIPTFCYYERELDQTHPFNKDTMNNVLGNNNRPYCRFYYGMDIQLNLVHFTNYGGEPMESVFGQTESNEYLEYRKSTIRSDKGLISNIVAFQIYLNQQRSQNINTTNGDDDDIQVEITEMPIIKVDYSTHYISKVAENMMISPRPRKLPNDRCTERVHGTTFFIQRYEYVNLYHTMTDWWNTWLSMETVLSSKSATGDTLSTSEYQRQQQRRQHRVVFLDSHPAGLLDDTWNILFGNSTITTSIINNHTENNDNNAMLFFDSQGENYTYLGHYAQKHKSPTTENDDTIICFDDAVFIPPGYLSESCLEWNQADQIGYCPDTIVTERFVDYVLYRFQLLQYYYLDGNNQTSLSVHKRDVIAMKPYHIVLIDRRPYVSHPRTNTGAFERVITNLDEVALMIQNHFSSTTRNVTYEIIQLDRYTMYEQIVKVRKAHILFGYHGAGLTHLLFLHSPSSSTSSKGAAVIEVDHTVSLFAKMARWKSIEHRMIPSNLASQMSSEYVQQHVIPIVEEIFQSYESNDG